MAGQIPLYTAEVQLYLFNTATSEYQDHGKAGLAVVGTHGTPGVQPPTFRLGCFIGDAYACTADITVNNETGLQAAVQGGGYVSFRDDQQRIWSVLFASEAESHNFGASVAVAMYGASSSPEASIVCYDVAAGKKERIVFCNDRVKCRYQSWVLQRGNSAVECPKLGSRLDGNEDADNAYVFTCPANHFSVTPDMKGFEGMVVGMSEEGRRYVVIPAAAKRGGGHMSVNLVFMVYVVKKKGPDETGSGGGQGGGSQGGGGGLANNSFGSAPNNQQQPHSNHAMGGGGGGSGRSGGSNPNMGMSSPGMSGQMGPGGGGGMHGMMLPNPAIGGQGNYGGIQPGMTVQQGPGGMLLLTPGPVDPSLGPLTLVAPAPIAQPTPVAAPAPAPAPTPAPVVMPPPPPPGFNLEQMETVNRMREQIGQLMLQLKEAQTSVDMFSHNFKQHEQKRRPVTLGCAQIEHTIRTMIADSDTLKEELHRRDESLKSAEEKNKALQSKLEKFASTADQLASERKMTITGVADAKLEGDRQVLSLQSQVTRLTSEREDVSRHLSTVKRLLEISDQETKGEKGRLQVAEVQMQTNETKLAATDESLSEERGRRKILEGKIATLGEELRATMEEVRTKDGQIEDRRRAIDSAKLHYTQIMEDERIQAASELREIRQELIDELQIRDRRFQEERLRVAAESFQRGKVQGVDDGRSEATLEADAKIQQLTLEAQRHRSEAETLKVRIRQISEASHSDQRRLEAQISALTRVVDDLGGSNSALSMELSGLENARESIVASTMDNLKSAFAKLTRPIGKRNLLGMLHDVRLKHAAVDYGFQSIAIKEEDNRLEAERVGFLAYLRQVVHTPTDPVTGKLLVAVQPPPLVHTFADELLPVPAGLAHQPDLSSLQPLGPAGVFPAASLAYPAEDGPNPAVLLSETVMREIEQRQRQLLQQLDSTDPSLQLVPPPPRPPSPPPPPPPPPAPAAPQPTLSSSPPSQRSSESAPNPQSSGLPQPSQQLPPSTSVERAAADHLPDLDDDDDDGDSAVRHSDHTVAPMDVASPSPNRDEHRVVAPPVSEAIAERGGVPADDEEEGAPPAARSTVSASQELRSVSPAPPVAPKAAAAPPPHDARNDDDDDDDAGRRKAARVAPKGAAPKQPAAAPQPQAVRRGVFGDDDDDEEEEEGEVAIGGRKNAPAARPVQVAAPPAATGSKKAAATKQTLFADDDSDDEDRSAAGRQPAPKKAAPTAAPKVAPKAAASSRLFADDSDSEDEKPPARRPAAAPAAPAAKKAVASKPAAKRGGLFESDSD